VSPDPESQADRQSGADFAAELGGELPLLELFYRLREAELPLGVAEYELLPRALMAGFGFDEDEPVESLKRLCRMLWIKTPDEEVIFEHVFARYLQERLLARPRSESTDRTAGAKAPVKPAEKKQAEAKEGAQPRKGFERLGGDKEQPESDKDAADRAKKIRQQRMKQTLASPDLRRADSGTFDEAGRFVSTSSDLVGRSKRERRYRFEADYLPITKRQMKQSWRYLRKPVREGPPVEFDVEATVAKVAVEGRLYEPVMVPRRINRAAMVLLVDQEGSMTPFHGFSRRLEETAVRGGRLGQTNVYYFNNYPLNVLYSNPQFSESRPLETVLGELHPTRTAILIFSDAGAARNRYSYERVDMTRAFLKRVYQSVRYVAWLNPMPAARWANTSAAAIAGTVPMFEVSHEGLQNAISVLRGRTVSRG
jgi:hypothetical protein